MDILGKRRIWYIISIIFMTLSVFFLLTNGLNMGIDFEGGSILHYSFEQQVSNEQVREVLQEIGVADARLQQTEEAAIPHGVIIRSDIDPDDTEKLNQIETALGERFPGAEELSSESVGAVIGQELRRNALWALLIASLAMVAYISFRFEFRFAIVAIITLLHDVILTVGLFALLGREINTPFVAALLTIIGYSINDTIVIFDRIRENMKLMHRSSFVELANKAVVETLPRSINTSITTLITVLAIFLFGGVAIQTFMLALLIGFAAGTYSSIFVASPLLVTWQEKITARKTA